MVRILLGMLLVLTGILPAYSQKTTIYTEPDREYRNGLELLERQKYGAARKSFEQVVESQASVSDDARISSRFYIGRCAAELFQPDAEFLLKDFIGRYPESSLADDAHYTLANLYYRQKKFKKALQNYKSLDRNLLTEEQRIEVDFKAGYSAYMTEEYDEASRRFYEVKDKDTKYATAAQYYYAHMAYVSQNYETALQEFLKLRQSESFAPVAPYYITQIYYKQGKYDKVLEYGIDAKDSAGARNGMEISRMIAESHYKKGNYTDAIKYLADYVKNSPNAGAVEDYELGFSHYKLGQYEKAIPYFQKLTNTEDSLAQNAYYHLAECYLLSKAKRNARTAYQSAARMKFDPVITEESRFAYAKLSYELSFQSVAIESIRSFMKDYPYSDHVSEANELLINLYAGTRNYRDALAALDAVKVKTPGMKAAYQKAAYYKGVEYFMDNKDQDALQLFQTSLSNQADPKLTAEALYWKGEAHYRLGQFDQSSASFNEYLKSPGAVSSPRYNSAHYNLGYASFRLERYPAAQTEFRKYVKEKGETDPGRYADALMRIADCNFVQGDKVAAADYYDQAVKAGSPAADYALYQRSIIFGVQGKLAEKSASLEKLIDDYPQSIYMDDALYENGQAYLTAGNNSKALTNFDRVINSYPQSSYVRKAELGKALVYYNSGDDIQAEAACKRIIERYPKTPEAHEALLQLKNIAVSRQKVDEYLAYVKNVPNADVSNSGKDSLIYESAELSYTQGDCEKTVKDFDSYIERFPDGIFIANANYYRSDCLFRSKKYEEALSGFEYVLAQPRSSFTEKSNVNAAFIHFRAKRYDKAAALYDVLETSADVKDNMSVARIGQMRCYSRLGNCIKALEAAGKILAASTADKDLQNEAQLITGRCMLQNGDLAKAKSSFSIVAKRTNSEMTAESKYS
ncbi:MAG: tetratricopeptide repeat protein, partial [Bacteroidota bacterium]